MVDSKKLLGEYVRSVLDINKDGVVNLKDFVGLIPNNAVAIGLIVIDLLVAVAEYRVWDFGLHITNNNPYKAAGFVLVSALPFYLAQVLWLYPRANFGQQAIAVLMGMSALWTSAEFGFADLSQSYDSAAIFKMVTRLTIAYVIALILYVLFDKNIRLKRAEIKARDNANFENAKLATTRTILESLRETLTVQNALIEEFGEDAVIAQLQGLQGSKKNRDKQLPAPKSQPVINRDNHKVPAEEPAVNP